MKKLYTNLKDIISRINKYLNHKKIIYIIVIIMLISIVAFSKSFAFIKKQVTGAEVDLKVGELEYTLECSKLTNQQITLSANSSETLNIVLTSNNPIDSKYELYYEIISPEELTNVVDGGHLITEDDNIIGIIKSNETKNISVALNNTGSQAVTLEIGLKAGLIHNELELTTEEKTLNNQGYLRYYVYDYNGFYQEFIAPQAGYYQLQTWGAGPDLGGGKGGYSTGNVSLTKNQPLYVVVGGSSSNSKGGYNGGGNGNELGSTANTYVTGGGGATHISTTNKGELKNYENYKTEVLIVAGGGGGGTRGTGNGTAYGGYGGGLTGGNGGGTYYGQGATQTAGGIKAYGAASNNAGSFGCGSNADPLYEVSYTRYYGGGGGGGWYGGSGGSWGDGAAAAGGGGGGSSYIDNVIDGVTIAGNSQMPTHNLTTTQTGNTGNGYARITFLGTDDYTIIYDSNGGTGTMENTIGLTNGIVALSSNQFTKEGYNFSGWSTSKDGNVIYKNQEKIITSTTTDKTITLYAVWEINKYTITYNANGGTNVPSPTTKIHNQDITLSTQIPTRAGYTFLGWSTSSSATTKTYSSGDTFTTDSNTILYAVWQANTYTITYDGNGGLYNGSPTWSEKVTYNTAYTTWDNFFTRSGYIFAGWNEKSDGTGISWTSYIGKEWIWTYTRDATLYAIWQKQQQLSLGFAYYTHTYSPSEGNHSKGISSSGSGTSAAYTIYCNSKNADRGFGSYSYTARSTSTVNLTDYNKVTAKVTISSADTVSLYIMNSSGTVVASNSLSTSGTLSVDVSNLSGSYYIGYYVYNSVNLSYDLLIEARATFYMPILIG